MKKEQCDDLLQQLVYGAFKKCLCSVNDGLGYGREKKDDMRQRYSENTYKLTIQENRKEIKSFKLF